MHKFVLKPILGLFAFTLLISTSPAFLRAEQAARYPGVIEAHVDATDLAHRVFKVTQRIPVSPGPFTLLHPTWKPGHHAPVGPIGSLAGLMITANGKRIAFKRDTLNISEFHLEIPPKTKEIEIRYDIITPSDPSQGRVVMTPTMLNLIWIDVLLYPKGFHSKNLTYKASVKMPKQWKSFCALDLETEKNDTFYYRSTDFDTLTDSPIFAGINHKTIDLDPGARIPFRLNIVADDPRFLEISEDALKAHRSLVQQSYKLFNSKHFDRYDFLLALSEHLSGIGLEHHRSSENAVKTAYFTSWNPNTGGPSYDALLPHELVHSWNGKFRRPADLNTHIFDEPMQNSLLWVYEGLTTYWGEVLAARSGFYSLKGAQDELAITGATQAENRPGYTWRSLQDTTNDPIVGRHRPRPYPSWQLGVEYYPAGTFLWMQIDSMIRDLTQGQRSLDDFAQAFFGVNDGSWEVLTYTFDDLVAELNRVANFDWRTFLRSKLDANESNHSQGLEAAGWKLVFKEKTNPRHLASMKRDQTNGDFLYSLGFTVGKDGKFKQVLWDSPAFNAGVAMGQSLIAINDRSYTPENLSDAIIASAKNRNPIQLLIKDFDLYKTVTISYFGGLRYPHLERIKEKPDHLTQILSPR